MVEEILIEISEDGQQVTIEGKHFSGDECTTLTREIEEHLGTVTQRRLKPEHRQVRQAGRTAVVR